MLPIKECLKIMHSGAVFSLSVVSFDKKRPHKSGIVTHYPEAVLVWGEGGDIQKGREVGARPKTQREARLSGLPAGKQPDHQGNYTRNIRLVANGFKTESLVKIHPPLIIAFNGQPTCP